MDLESATQKLRSIGQEHLLAGWSSLQAPQRAQLLQQIEALDVDLFRKQQALIFAKETPFKGPFNSFTNFAHGGDLKDQERGRALMAAGKVGCLLVAGGQGTRLGLEGPKGIYPISPIKHKTLFQLFAEKTGAASRQAGILLPLAVMTSPLNHRETVAFFEQNQHFGLQAEQLFFFVQKTLPFLDAAGNLLLESPDTLASGPDGNGSALQELVASGIWQKWRQNGVEFLNFVLVDNPLADPFDANLIGFHERQGCEVTVKCIERQDPEEKVGILVNSCQVVEYTEVPDNERLNVDKHRLANLSLFSFSASFIESHASAQLPLHLAWKKNLWKFEKFIFDLLPMAKKVKALVYPREETFAPLKSAEDVPHVKKALQQMDAQVYRRISGLEPPDRPFELAQDFYYPTEELLVRWRQRPLPDSEYINWAVV